MTLPSVQEDLLLVKDCSWGLIDLSSLNKHHGYMGRRDSEQGQATPWQSAWWFTQRALVTELWNSWWWNFLFPSSEIRWETWSLLGPERHIWDTASPFFETFLISQVSVKLHSMGYSKKKPSYFRTLFSRNVGHPHTMIFLSPCGGIFLYVFWVIKTEHLTNFHELPQWQEQLQPLPALFSSLLSPPIL